uniref:uncharacterized protein LOC101315429 isoform X1 n=1 Tax=Fragaria vesca subsp. vesca TaxID=101020 RepID=UPI0005CAC1FC|nr:PREDICTED: uncharacterized protein LOC101315429 isoform X1 [Fragaria vesca subsp. vesca]
MALKSFGIWHGLSSDLSTRTVTVISAAWSSMTSSSKAATTGLLTTLTSSNYSTAMAMAGWILEKLSLSTTSLKRGTSDAKGTTAAYTSAVCISLALLALMGFMSIALRLIYVLPATASEITITRTRTTLTSWIIMYCCAPNEASLPMLDRISAWHSLHPRLQRFTIIQFTISITALLLHLKGIVGSKHFGRLILLLLLQVRLLRLLIVQSCNVISRNGLLLEFKFGVSLVISDYPKMKIWRIDYGFTDSHWRI